MSELLKYALSGGNLIPTLLLIIVLIYWLSVIIGVFDFDLFDVDVDVEVDVDVDIGDGSGPFHAILGFLKVGDVPIMFVFSLMILNFWIIAMVMYYLPIPPGGLINSLLLIPGFVLSVFITKLEFLPFKGLFKRGKIHENEELEVIRHLCKLKCDISGKRLGQAEIERDGASVILNVMTEFDNEVFLKDETACIFRKDDNKNVYYIVKVEGVI